MDREPETNEFGNAISVVKYMHCAVCLRERPADTTPQDWADLSVGWTRWGLQVWCNRHECNVIHIDFEGHKHPANTEAPKPPDGPRLATLMGESVA